MVFETNDAYIEVYITWGRDKYNIPRALEIDIIRVTTDAEDIEACDMCNEDRNMWVAIAWGIFLQKYED